MEKIKCPECGQVNEFANDSCINCGFPFDEIKEEEFERQIKKAEEYITKGANISIINEDDFFKMIKLYESLYYVLSN